MGPFKRNMIPTSSTATSKMPDLGNEKGSGTEDEDRQKSREHDRKNARKGKNLRENQGQKMTGNDRKLGDRK